MPCNHWTELARAVKSRRLAFMRVPSNRLQAAFAEGLRQKLMKELRLKLIRAREAADRHRGVCPICRSEPPKYFPDLWDDRKKAA
jgi:hypothetical protein